MPHSYIFSKNDTMTTMKVHRSTLNELLKRGKMGDTYEIVILNLLETDNDTTN